MKDKTYKIIEHTADIGIRVRAKTLKSLFQNTGLAIFDLSAEKINNKTGTQKEMHIKLKADNLEELFLDWLNELISLSAAKGIIFEKLKIEKVTETSLDAIAAGYDIKNYKVNSEIKAATYHQLKVKKNVAGWLAEVILDV